MLIYLYIFSFGFCVLDLVRKFNRIVNTAVTMIIPVWVWIICGKTVSIK